MMYGGGQAMGGGGMGGMGGQHRDKTAKFVPGKVFLGGLSNDSSDESLQAYAGQWGEIAEVHVMSGKGYGFATFRHVCDAQAFLDQSEHIIDGRRVDARAAVPRDQGGGKKTKKMFVGGIGDVTDEEFTSYFSQFGNIEDATVVRKQDGSSRGYGFVNFDDEVAVEKCLVQLHELGGKVVDVKRAMGKDEHQQRGQQNMMGGGMGPGMGAMGMAGMMGAPGMGMMPQMGMMPNMGMMGDGSGMGGGAGNRKQPDWTCPECGNQNFGWRPFCNRCKVPKAGGDMSGMGGGMNPMAMGGMGAGMMNPMMAGGMGGYGNMMAANPAAMGNMMGAQGMANMGMMGGMDPSMASMAAAGMGGGMGAGMGGVMPGNMGGGMGGGGAQGMGGGYGRMGGRGQGMGGGGGGYGRMGGRGGGGGQNGQQRFRPY